MPTIFGQAAGAVTRIDTPSAAPGAVSIGGNTDESGLTWDEGVIYTGFSIDFRSNVQYMQTLDNSVFVYVYGDHSGSVVITGMATQGPDPCASSSGSAGVVKGLPSLVTFWDAAKVSRSLLPVYAFGGGIGIRGYLDRVSAQYTEAVFAKFSLYINAAQFLIAASAGAPTPK